MKNKKKWIIAIGIVLLLIILAVTTFFILKNTILLPKTIITQNQDLSFEVNSEVKLLSLIGSIENGTITSEDILIDSSTLGEKEVAIRYKNERNKEIEYIVRIKIIDTQAPVIESETEYTTEVGTEINLLEKVKVTDNSREEIKPTIEGEYAFNVEGEYKLKYVATDSTNNRAEKEFTFKVTPKPVIEQPKNNNTGNSSNKNTSNTKPSNSGNTGNSNTSNNNNNNTTTPPKEDTEEQKRLDAMPAGTCLTYRPNDAHSTWTKAVFGWTVRSSEGWSGGPSYVTKWQVSYSSSKNLDKAEENAKKYLPPQPPIGTITREEAEAHGRYGNTTLYVKLGGLTGV